MDGGGGATMDSRTISKRMRHVRAHVCRTGINCRCKRVRLVYTRRRAVWREKRHGVQKEGWKREKATGKAGVDDLYARDGYTQHTHPSRSNTVAYSLTAPSINLDPACRFAVKNSGRRARCVSSVENKSLAYDRRRPPGGGSWCTCWSTCHTQQMPPERRWTHWRPIRNRTARTLRG